MTRRLRRLLIAFPSAGLGGAELQTAMLAEDLAEAGMELALAIDPALLPRFARMVGPRLAPLLHPAEIAWRGERGAGENIARQAREAALLRDLLRPDAVLLPLPWPSHGLGLLHGFAGLPLLAVAHLAPEALPHEEEAAARAAPPAQFVAVAAPTAARLARAFGLPVAAVTVIPNGVPVPPDSPAARRAARAAKRAMLELPDTAKLLLFAGRLDPAKGADLLPGIAQALRGRASLAVAGQGGLRPALQGQGLWLLGQVPDVPDWLLAADALLLPSRHEGCPLVFLEAAARHCPVIATEAALEAFPEPATLAALSRGPGIARLAALAVEALDRPDPARIAAAHRLACRQDRAAMLGQYRARLRALIA
ncbi:glycosyltransferase [Siccirubricoccus phaeus]|uniref:glycosyltransferase n=1 Tax=Siccirubricoccus phaeus TaxID=2595053 RepID=UPI0011F17E66|nr:glycosyltransferase [Siccirubricoccus phaeus]